MAAPTAMRKPEAQTTETRRSLQEAVPLLYIVYLQFDIYTVYIYVQYTAQ
jgi:hypothetical protein